jgi:nuclear pore complex protein Nup133
VDVTDDELTAKYQNTALYATLACGPKYVLEPSGALTVPSTTDITSRWPGLPPDQVEAMERDFAMESRLLEGLELENDYKRVKELVAQDAEEY